MRQPLPEEWWTNENPSTLLNWSVGLHTPRKLRLFAVECCRGLKTSVTDPRAWQALQTASDFADGQASAEQLRESWLAVRQALSRAPLSSRWEYALNALLHAASPQLTLYDAQNAARQAAQAGGYNWVYHDLDLPQRAFTLDRPEAMQQHCRIVRDLFPFRPITIAPQWLRWEQGQLARLALALYEEQRFEDMPILADALEEAGCDDPVLLEHARQRGSHFRGCWLVDALLDRR
jgi:hypothetical protein